MKVLHVIPSVSPIRGGTSRAILDMTLALQRSGLDVEIATTDDHGSKVLPVLLNQRTQYEQVPIYFFPRRSSSSLSLQEFNLSNDLTKWLWQNITRYDLVHVHALFSYPSTIAMVIARLKKVPYITVPHGLLCHWSLQQSARKKKLFLKLIERSNLSNSNALHLTSQMEAQEVKDLDLLSHSFVLPLGLNMPQPVPDASKRLRQSLNILDNSPIILFMGRIHPKKGLDYLIAALGQLKHLPFHFVLAGSGDLEYESEVTSFLKAADIENKTYRLGFVEGEQKDTILQGANLFALTSHSENFGVAVLESLAAGVPVLLTPGVALSAMVLDNKLGYVVDLDVKAISTCLSEILKNKQANDTIGRKAQYFMEEHYTWDKIALRLIQIYADTLNQSSVLQHA